jgi:flagellar motor switch/type III secretory pathway protein FliN
LRWAASANEPPTAEIEIYRLGSELDAFAAADVDVAARMAGQRLAGDMAGNIEPAGVVDTKFGPVTLLRLRGVAAAGRQACLGFVKTFTTPNLRISGWACQADTLAAQRAFLGCTLNRLTLLSAGNDPRMAEAITEVPVEVTAELGRVKLGLRRVLSLEVGQVLRLVTAVDDPVIVRIGGVEKFRGAPVISRGQVSVEIRGRHED